MASSLAGDRLHEPKIHLLRKLYAKVYTCREPYQSGVAVYKPVSLTIFGPRIAIQYFLYYAPAVLVRGISGTCFGLQDSGFRDCPSANFRRCKQIET